MKLPLIFDNAKSQRVVLVSAFGVFIIFGVRLSFSVFFAEFTNANHWSSSSSASIFSLNMIFFAFVSVPSGMLLDRWGPQIIFSIGSFLLGISLFLCSLATQVWHLQITYGILGGAALGMIGLGAFGAIIAGWVVQRRGLAIGITFAGTGLGALIFVPLCERLITWLGWQQAYLVLAGLCIFVLAPVMAIGQLKPPQLPIEKMEERVNRRQLLRLPAFWWLLLVSFTALGPLRALTVHQIAYLQEVGINRLVAARYVGTAGFLTIFAYIGWGYVSDRFGRVMAFVLGAICLLSATVILLMLDGLLSPYILLTFYSILVALGEGTRSSQTTALASDIFRDKGLGFINGIVGAMFGIGAAIMPWLVGYLRDHQGNYRLGFEIVIGVVLLSIFSFIMVKRQAPKADDLELISIITNN